jgi:hypothetical protein
MYSVNVVRAYLLLIAAIKTRAERDNELKSFNSFWVDSKFGRKFLRTVIDYLPCMQVIERDKEKNKVWVLMEERLKNKC